MWLQENYQTFSLSKRSFVLAGLYCSDLTFLVILWSLNFESRVSQFFCLKVLKGYNQLYYIYALSILRDFNIFIHSKAFDIDIAKIL